MNKTFLLFAFITCYTMDVKAQSTWSNKTRVLPDKLRELPVGLTMWHAPNPCYPELIDGTYYWKHTTSATTVKADLHVIECGSFIWYNESGWQANMSFSPVEFAKAFNCPGAKLKHNRIYTFQKNWRYGKQVYGGDALWSIIAEDSAGKRYKGYAIVETESTVLNNIN